MSEGGRGRSPGGGGHKARSRWDSSSPPPPRRRERRRESPPPARPRPSAPSAASPGGASGATRRPPVDSPLRGRQRQRSRSPPRRQRGSPGREGPPPDVGPDGEPDWGTDGPPVPKEKPNFATSGKLGEETNTYKGVVIKYSQPPEARKPTIRWRLYPFKGEEQLPVIYIHRESAYLIGRDRVVVDLPVDHPSCSKQHAVLQYRQVTDKSTGRAVSIVKPYVIDLESTNGTYVNGDRIQSRRYVELLEKDVIKFGFSTREYVLLHDQSLNEDA